MTSGQRWNAFLQRTHLIDWIQAVLLIVAMLVAADGFWTAVRRIFRVTRWLDFQVYYLSARLLAQASPVYSIADRTALGQALDLTPMVYNYPPFFTALFSPLAALPFRSAAYVWVGVGAAAIALMLWMLGRALSLSVWKIALLGLIAVLMPATIATFSVGQASLFLTLFFVSALVVAPQTNKAPNSIAAGILLGVAAGMKVYPVLFALPYLIHRRFKILVVMAGAFVATLAVGILSGGFHDTWMYWTQILPQAGELNLYPPNQSVRAVVQRLFESYAMETTVDKQSVTIALIPLFDAPRLGNLLGWAAVGVILALTVWILFRRKREMPARDAFIYNYALMVPTIMMVIPLSWDHYEPHLILPLAVVGLYKTAKPAPRILFALACLFLALHRYWTVVLVETPYAGLMMSGFLGALATWLALLWNPLTDGAPQFDRSSNSNILVNTTIQDDADAEE